MSKTALIVDDSKSARVLLQRVLERHELGVDTAESAEDALEYLGQRRPDVIFMDHQMPGMDGFEAVTAIKQNPDTATIPIMMYTSQKGEVYVGQARALGAVGVLPKELAPVEVSKVLKSLHLIESEAPQASSEAEAKPPPVRLASLKTLDEDLRLLIQELFEQQQAVIRRDFLDSYEALATRVAEEVRPPVDPGLEAQRAGDSSSAGMLRLAVVVFIVATVVFAMLYHEAWQDQQTLRDQFTELQQALESQRASSETALNQALETQRRTNAQENLQAFEQIAEFQQSLDSLYAANIGSLVWAANQAPNYAFGELPLGDDRLQVLEQLTEQLEAINFSGAVQIETHSGDFCQNVSGTSGYVLAENLPASDCDLIDTSLGESLDSLGQSVAFANFIQLSEERNRGRIRYEILSRGNSQPLLSYPANFAGVTAEAWNRIAAANNRVVISLLPDGG